MTCLRARWVFRLLGILVTSFAADLTFACIQESPFDIELEAITREPVQLNDIRSVARKREQLRKLEKNYSNHSRIDEVRLQRFFLERGVGDPEALNLATGLLEKIMQRQGWDTPIGRKAREEFLELHVNRLRGSPYQSLEKAEQLAREQLALGPANSTILEKLKGRRLLAKVLAQRGALDEAAAELKAGIGLGKSWVASLQGVSIRKLSLEERNEVVEVRAEIDNVIATLAGLPKYASDDVIKQRLIVKSVSKELIDNPEMKFQVRHGIKERIQRWDEETAAHAESDSR